jgi:hypothetical protein
MTTAQLALYFYEIHPVETWAQLVFSSAHTSVHLHEYIDLAPENAGTERTRCAFVQRMFCAVSELIFPCGFALFQ